jgi:peroxiredoxin
MTPKDVRVGAFAAAAVAVACLSLLPAARPMEYRVARHFGIIGAPPPATPGQPLASLSLASLEGTPVSFSDRPGRSLVINVFTSWCPSCNQEMPAISSATASLNREGVDVVGIDQAESSEQVRRFIASYNLTYPVYIDTNQSTRTLLDARVIPTTVFVDRHDIVRYVHVGPLDTKDFVSMAKTVASE